MNSELIKRNGHLFWYVSERDKDKISLDALVETILNYGDLEAVRYLLRLVGIKTVSEIFLRQISNNRVNYFPQVINFFSLYFHRHAPGSADREAV